MHENCEDIGDEIHTAELHIAELIHQEVGATIQKLKNNKATGNESIPAELLKYRGAAYFQNLSTSMCHISREVKEIVLEVHANRNFIVGIGSY